MHKKHRPLVSVIVPCYNYGHFLAEALESLIAQTWGNWECIIVDDGSIDNTKDVANDFESKDARFRYIYQKNQGLSSARNTGLAACKGDYVQFLDADDGIEKKKLEKQIAYLERHPEIDIVYGKVHYFKDEVSRFLDVALDRKNEPDGGQMIPVKGDALALLVRANFMVVNASLSCRSSLRDVGGFNVNLRSHEDWEYWIRCALAGKQFHYLAEEDTHALVRLHRASMSKGTLPMVESNLEIRKMLSNLPLSKESRRVNHFRINVEYAKLARFEIGDKKIFVGLQHAMRALLFSGCNIRIILYFLGALLPDSFEYRLKLAAKRLNLLS